MMRFAAGGSRFCFCAGEDVRLKRLAPEDALVALSFVVEVLDVQHAEAAAFVNECLVARIAIARQLLGGIFVISRIGHCSHLLR